VLIPLLFLLLAGYSQQFYLIPGRSFNPYDVLGYNTDGVYYYAYTEKINFTMKIDSLDISKQITLGQYKEYLNAIKKDSSYSFYLTQLPDSNITTKENYTKYITDKKYDNFPAAGISWEAAMNFCKWKTLNENKSGKINYIYRLPKLSEWLDAHSYLENNKYESDFNRNYSDWTMNTYYEGSFTSKADSSFSYDVFYLPKPTDRPRVKRVRIIGDSYLYQRENLIHHSGSFYTFNGYRQVAFRMVKEDIHDKKPLADKVITYWDLQGPIKK
jgi:hypothetical protein